MAGQRGLNGHFGGLAIAESRRAEEDDRVLDPELLEARLRLEVLGEDADREKTSPYAAPARAEDLSGLPPAFIQTNGLDPLRDEGIEYALRLLAAGIPVELYNCPGAYHGAPPLDERTAALAFQVYNAALGAALNPDDPTSGF